LHALQLLGFIRNTYTAAATAYHFIVPVSLLPQRQASATSPSAAAAAVAAAAEARQRQHQQHNSANKTT
jgi:hypothetical protein